MSRLSLVASLVLALASTASARAVRAPMPPLPDAGGALSIPSHFSEPPGNMPVSTQQPRALDRATVRAALAKARERNLAQFRAYQQRGVFPSNTFEDRKLNVWRDADGHLCAAATIINASGAHDLVNRVAEQNNFIRLADVRQGPLMDWILTSGFTQDEIAAIQEPFSPVVRRPVVTVDPDLRTAEDARLRAKYTAVTRMLVAKEKTSLDAATDRLRKHPQLAWSVIR